MSGPWVRPSSVRAMWGALFSLAFTLPMMGHAKGPGGRFLCDGLSTRKKMTGKRRRRRRRRASMFLGKNRS